MASDAAVVAGWVVGGASRCVLLRWCGIRAGWGGAFTSAGLQKAGILVSAAT